MKIKLFIFISFLSFSLRAQFTTVNFEINSSVIKIDTSQPNNIWQIGKPQKLFFDSAYSKSKAIVTDTLNSYPVNNISSFQFVIKEPTPNTWGNQVTPGVTFYHKYNTDSLLDGGYIEVSYNGGATWINAGAAPEISLYTTFDPYGQDTIQGGIKAFSGNAQSNWSECLIYWYQWCNMSPSQIIPDSIIVKFTFISDGIQTNKDGWMIDDIQYGTASWPCFVGVNDLNTLEPSVNIFPNPTTDKFSIELTNGDATEISLFDIVGKQVNPTIKSKSNKMEIDVSALIDGIYFVQIKTAARVIMKKVVVQR